MDYSFYYIFKLSINYLTKVIFILNKKTHLLIKRKNPHKHTPIGVKK